ncbi:MAG: photosynthetic complex putative assembly protein PuhB [Myxococcaceae bacterium]|nr:photosynthetic complex putative assembly protein PuhB [Myxococcaceae bacterium]
MSDVELEDIPGLPGKLPAGEFVMWQGRPDWKALAFNTFKLPWVATWLMAFVGLRIVAGLQRGEGSEAVMAGSLTFALSAGGLAILAVLAWGYARATVYTITSRRVVLRIGVAIPLTINLPFKKLVAADLRSRALGTGDVVLTLAKGERLAWLYLWPHVKALSFSAPRPSLLSVKEPTRVADTLREAVQRWAETEGVAIGTTSASTAPHSQPAPMRPVNA